MEKKNIIELRTGLYSSLLLTILTIVGFGFAMIAIPPAGPYCPENCMEYPYVDIMTYFPRDYFWMYIISFQLIAYLIFVIANHFNAPEERKIFSFISVAIGLISVTLLLADYFVQYSVVPISVLKNQTEGIALLTQYNGHGIFIVIEELGFTLMSISFLFLSFIFSGKSRLIKAIRWILSIPFIVTVISFVFYALKYGLDRDYRFEVATITINWLVCIIIGILMSFYFKSKIREN